MVDFFLIRAQAHALCSPQSTSIPNLSTYV
jgi:hypothetical protein